MTSRQELALTEIFNWVEEEIKSSGDCDHSVNICYCGIKAWLADGYEIIHTDSPSKHIWVIDFDWEANTCRKVLRCNKCYAVKEYA